MTTKSLEFDELIEQLMLFRHKIEDMAHLELDEDSSTVSGWRKWEAFRSILSTSHPEIGQVIKLIEIMRDFDTTTGIKFKTTSVVPRQTDEETSERTTDKTTGLPLWVKYGNAQLEEQQRKKFVEDMTTAIKKAEDKVTDASTWPYPQRDGFRLISGLDRCIHPSRYQMDINDVVIDRKTGKVLVMVHEKQGTRCIDYYEFQPLNPSDPIVKINTEYLHSITWGDKKPLVEKIPEFVWVDWILGIPKRKYKVFPNGDVLNTYTDEKLARNASTKIVLNSASDRSGFCRGDGRSYRYTVDRASLVWRAFHPADQKDSRVWVRPIDGDTLNCSLENLRRVR